MRLTLALCCLLNVTPALARCHSIWHYPWKQNCRAVAAPVHPRTWFVEIKPEPVEPEVIPPIVTADEEAARAAAVDQLRMELRERAVSALELSTTGLTRAEETK